MEKIRYIDKNLWQDKVGYCRAMKINNQILISGTVANDDEGNLLGKNDVEIQTKVILQKFKEVMEHFGYSLENIVRTRIFTTDITRWEEIGLVHGEYFNAIKPVTSMVEVSKLISPDYLVEIEAEAIIEN